MKKYRPLNAGYILVYVIVIAVILQGIWTLIAMMLRQGAQTQNSATSMLDMWTLILVPFAVIYGNHYRQTVVELSPTAMRIVRPAVVYPKEGEKRASFVFRQGGSDNVLIRRKFELSQLAKYGYAEEFGLRPEDKSGAKTDARLFPVHEVAFIMQDGRNCRMNAAIYKPAQLREMFTTIREATGVEPTGKLAEVLQAQEGAPA